jgi:tetratricopeptide (TPR) repeat protein
MNIRKGLSTRDAGILTLLFDAEAQPRKQPSILEHQNPTIPEPPLNAEQLKEAQHFERRAIQLAEEGELEKAEELLNHAIKKYPRERPSLWNNRAQVRRLLGDIRGALDDLSQVILLATSRTNNQNPSDNAKVLSHAHTHRATIYMLVARNEISGVLEEQTPERLEELASHDFTLAGKYGSDLARAMAVRTNPYAKMCGAIVQTALQKEMQAGV